MEVKAQLRHLRMSPRKVRLVADLVRNKKVEEAQNILKFTVKRATNPLLKLLNSAIANAENNFKLDKSKLFISEIKVDQGPTLKRWKPRARGRVDPINKRTSHVTLILDTSEEVQPSKATPETPEAKPQEEVKKSEVSEPLKKKRPKPRKEIKKPKGRKGIKERIFRRKSI